MPTIAEQVLAFNRGKVSPLAVGRADIDKVSQGARTFTNWMPRILGPMALRPGLAYVGASNQSRYIPFVFSSTDTALIEISNLAVRIWISEAVMTRNTVSTAFTNGTFTSDISTGWTENNDDTTLVGTDCEWVTGGYLSLRGGGYPAAKIYQQLTIAGGDQNVAHGLRVVVRYGPVTIRIGTTNGDDNLLTETQLGTGDHHLLFTPTGASAYVELSNRLQRVVQVDSIAIETGAVSMTGPWATADLANLRWDASGDITYIACTGCRPYKIERRATGSWSVVAYEPEDGPFRLENVSGTRLNVGALEGDTTLSATAPVFRSSHVGALFRVRSESEQITSDYLLAANQHSDYIRVYGSSQVTAPGTANDRRFSFTLSGTWVGTVLLQRAIGEPEGWTNVDTATTYTVNGTTNFSDGLSNVIVYYRLVVSAYTGGVIQVSMNYPGGSGDGICVVRSFTSSVSVNVSILRKFKSLRPTDQWSEGKWSAYRGYPSEVAIHEGRWFWLGRGFVDGTVVDAPESFDEDDETDAGPISRSLGTGPIDVVNWAVGLNGLVFGTARNARAARSSSFDEPLTPSAFSIKPISSRGSAKVPAVVVDQSVFYVHEAGARVFEAAFGGDGYVVRELSELVPEIGSPGIVRVAVQDNPDTRVHFVRSDGTVAILIINAVEQVTAWIDFTTDGTVEDVVVLPGTNEDNVYYLVNRTGGRYLERWALESQAQGGQFCRCLDSHITYSGVATSTLTGLSHLNGKTVVVWGGSGTGDIVGSYTVSGGSITLAVNVTHAVIGLPYTATWRSMKLGRAFLTKRGTLGPVGLILGPSYRQGLKVGTDAAHLDYLSLIEDGADVSNHTTYDQPPYPINASINSDSSLYLQTVAPRYATVIAVVADVTKF